MHHDPSTHSLIRILSQLTLSHAPFYQAMVNHLPPKIPSDITLTWPDIWTFKDLDGASSRSSSDKATLCLLSTLHSCRKPFSKQLKWHIHVCNLDLVYWLWLVLYLYLRIRSWPNVGVQIPLPHISEIYNTIWLLPKLKSWSKHISLIFKTKPIQVNYSAGYHTNLQTLYGSFSFLVHRVENGWHGSTSQTST